MLGPGLRANRFAMQFHLIFWPLLLAGTALALLLLRHYPDPAARLFRALLRRLGRLRSTQVDNPAAKAHLLSRRGGPELPLVLLHGLGADADHWCQLCRELPADTTIVAPDLPGFGDTPPLSSQHTDIAATVEWLRELLDRLEIGVCDLGGNSMGGYLAARFALEHPRRVRSLWLIAPGNLQTAPLTEALAAVDRGEHNPLVIRDLADQNRLIDLTMTRPPWIPVSLRRWLATRGIRQSATAAGYFDALRFHAAILEALAPRLDQPTLLVWGRQDQLLHPSGAQILHRLLPDSQLVELADVGHLPMIEAPRRCARDWLDFRAGLAPDTTA